VCGAKSEQGLKCSLWCPAAVMTEDELVKVDLQLMASDSVVGSDEPLLKIPDGAIGERHNRLGSLSEIRTEWFHTRDKRSGVSGSSQWRRPSARRHCTSPRDNERVNPELARFCINARGSATELEYQLLLARDLKWIQPDDYETLSAQTVEIKRMLTVLVQKLTAESLSLIARGQPNLPLWLRPQAALGILSRVVEVGWGRTNTRMSLRGLSQPGRRSTRGTTGS
jgi:hypothetical protein